MEISLEADCLVIHWADESAGRYPYLWLRDTDPAGFHPQTGERTFDLTTIAPDIRAIRATVNTGKLTVYWPDRQEPSRFALDWIYRHQPGQQRHDPAQVAPQLWRNNNGTFNVQRFAADDILHSDAVLNDWLRATKRDGLTLVDGLADSIEAGTAIAMQVGQLRKTNFGTTFEVVSKSEPNNLAYTADALPLHTDLTNQELPPGYQFLHCLANEADGGGSLFCDGFSVATDMQKSEPHFADRLASVSVPFRFHDIDTDIRSRKHVITRNQNGDIDEICFNAHLADILDLQADALLPYYAAYRHFMMMSRSSEYVVTYRLLAGEMVVFDNRRILHGREAFEAGIGNRHLHGCYVDRVEWDSRLRVLSRGTP